MPLKTCERPINLSSQYFYFGLFVCYVLLGDCIFQREEVDEVRFSSFYNIDTKIVADPTI